MQVHIDEERPVLNLFDANTFSVLIHCYPRLAVRALEHLHIGKQIKSQLQPGFTRGGIFVIRLDKVGKSQCIGDI
jgi:hypothetical protein